MRQLNALQAKSKTVDEDQLKLAKQNVEGATRTLTTYTRLFEEKEEEKEWADQHAATLEQELRRGVEAQAHAKNELAVARAQQAAALVAAQNAATMAAIQQQLESQRRQQEVINKREALDQVQEEEKHQKNIQQLQLRANAVSVEVEHQKNKFEATVEQMVSLRFVAVHPLTHLESIAVAGWRGGAAGGAARRRSGRGADQPQGRGECDRLPLTMLAGLRVHTGGAVLQVAFEKNDQRIEAQEGSMDKKLADEQAGSAENLVDEQKETEKLEKKLAAQKRILEEQVIRFVI